MLVLEVIEGVDRGRMFPLPDGEPQLLGRSSESVPLTDTSVSRRHAELTPDGDRWWIRDLQSANGTWINGKRVDSRLALSPGDEIICGDTRLRIGTAKHLIGGPATRFDHPLQDSEERDAEVSAAEQLQQIRLASMGETVATISHAVKNIMQGLRGGAGALELALERGDLNLAREAWPILSRNLDRIHDLTFNMLAWSRGPLAELEQIQVEPIVREAMDLLETQCLHRRVTMSLKAEENLPPIPVDPSAIHQAMLNLLTNAIEASPSKTGRIEVSIEIDPTSTWLRCSVADNGDGVDPGQIHEIFKPFTSTKGQRGTGLGLAVTQKIAQEHGGRLEVDPAVSEGARFLLWLPLDHSADPGDTDTPRRRMTPIDRDQFEA